MSRLDIEVSLLFSTISDWAHNLGKIGINKEGNADLPKNEL